VGFENLNTVRPEELVYRILGIFQIYELPGGRGTSFTAGCGQAFCDSVVAKRALLGYMLSGMQKTAPVGTGLDAIPTAKTILLVH
jgi:hypothetical protein